MLPLLIMRAGLGACFTNFQPRVNTVTEFNFTVAPTQFDIMLREITVQSRYGGGVRAMRVSEESRVVTLARAPKEETSGDDGQEESQIAAGDEAAGETDKTAEDR